MKTISVNPVKFERLKRYLWQACLNKDASNLPILMVVEKQFTGGFMEKLYISEDNRTMTARVTFDVFNSNDYERMTNQPKILKLHNEEYQLSVMGVKLMQYSPGEKPARVELEVMVHNKGGRFSHHCRKLFNVFSKAAPV